MHIKLAENIALMLFVVQMRAAVIRLQSALC
jgi:hypothetical protein